jgi:hypothetical protein
MTHLAANQTLFMTHLAANRTQYVTHLAAYQWNKLRDAFGCLPVKQITWRIWLLTKEYVTYLAANQTQYMTHLAANKTLFRTHLAANRTQYMTHLATNQIQYVTHLAANQTIHDAFGCYPVRQITWSIWLLNKHNTWSIWLLPDKHNTWRIWLLTSQTNYMTHLAANQTTWYVISLVRNFVLVLWVQFNNVVSKCYPQFSCASPILSLGGWGPGMATGPPRTRSSLG